MTHLLRSTNEALLEPLPPLLEHPLNQLVKPSPPLDMYRMTRLLPLHELGLGHAFLEVYALGWSYKLIFVPREYEDLGDVR